MSTKKTSAKRVIRPIPIKPAPVKRVRSIRTSYIDRTTVLKETDIPPPTEVADTRSLYPVAELQPGESFSYDVIRGKETDQLRSCRQACTGYKSRVDPKANFVTRLDERERRIRCWRIADSK